MGDYRVSNRISATFDALQRARRTALAPFVTIGFPDAETSEALAEAVLEAGADLLELGIPFSDPLAEGPTVQRTSHRALQQGTNVGTGLAVVRSLRAKGVEAPLVFMGYYNPYVRYGVERLTGDAAEAGLDGFIVPDLPAEEAGPFKKACDQRGLSLIPLLAPTSTDRRIADACRGASGFIYCVSVRGVTGARQDLAAGLPELVGRIRNHTRLPILIGFGVSRREHVEAIGRIADGAVVGSALLQAIDDSPPGQVLQTAREFIQRLTGRPTEDG